MIKKLLNKKKTKKKNKFHSNRNSNFKNFQLKINYNKINFLYLYSGILIFLIISFFMVLFWPFFKIKKIEIIKNDKNTNRTIAYSMLEKYRWKKLFKVNKEKIKKDLLSYQENLKEIKISKKLPNTLKIELSSYKNIFFTKLNNKIYFITENWVFIPSSSSWSLKKIDIFLQKNPKYPEYRKIIKEKNLQKINYLLKKINKNLLEINITEISYYVSEREVHYKTNNNTLFIFDLNGNLDEQFEKLAIFNKEKNLLIKPWIIYIDLRIPEKIFYCDIETEFDCYNNLKNIYPQKNKK